jgi:hypothetical protein
MLTFKRALLSGAATGLVSSLLLVSGAHASTISIGLQEAGFNGGNIQVETSSSTGSASITAVSFGTWNVNTVTAEDVTVLGLPHVLNTNAQDISTTAAGVLKVYVTDVGLTTPVDSVAFRTDFAINDLAQISGATLTSYLSQSNLPFALTNQIDTAFFTSIDHGTGTGKTFTGVTAPYSVTEVYTFTNLAGFSGNSNATIDLNGVGTSAVPLPPALAMFGSGLVGMVFLARKKKNRSSIAAE